MTNLTLYQTYFDFELELCKLFSALTPFSIRKEKAREVFLLMKRLNDANKRQSRPTKIKRQAGDDWF